jgi:Skp family chaperone for outer membrane proteins
MKRILLFCCLFAAPGMFANAQEAQPQSHTANARPTVSKSNYTAAVSQLYTITGQGRKDDAQAKWNEVHQMMHASFGVIKFKVKDAMEAHNETEKTRLMEVLKKQTALYNQVNQMREDLIGNRQKMNDKLIEFGTGIIE